MAEHAIVHIEIPASDTQGAGKFYADLFGWKLHNVPEMNYLMFQPESGPGGAFVQPGDTPAHFEHRPGQMLLYVGTDDIDATLQQVEQLGGKIVARKTEIPGQGWFGVFTDPAGNQVALYTESSGS